MSAASSPLERSPQKAVIRDVGRVLGMSYADVDVVAKAVPNDLHITIEKALEGPLGDMVQSSDELRRLIDISTSARGMPRMPRRTPPAL